MTVTSASQRFSVSGSHQPDRWTSSHPFKAWFMLLHLIQLRCVPYAIAYAVARRAPSQKCNCRSEQQLWLVHVVDLHFHNSPSLCLLWFRGHTDHPLLLFLPLHCNSSCENISYLMSISSNSSMIGSAALAIVCDPESQHSGICGTAEQCKYVNVQI